MLDPVNNRGYYEYSKINTQTGMQTDSGEKFSLEYEKKEDDLKSQEEKKDSEKNGVVVELSGKSNSQLKNYSSATNPYNTFEEEIDLGKTVEQAKNIFKNIRKFFADFMQNIRKTLYDIWNSEGNNAVTGVVEETASIEADSTEAEFAETDLTQAKESFRKDENASTETLTGIKTPDINSPDYVEQIRSYLDESKEIHYVKNSDLLTYYDRSGKIVKMNGADKKRILKGDGSELKG